MPGGGGGGGGELPCDMGEEARIKTGEREGLRGRQNGRQLSLLSTPAQTSKGMKRERVRKGKGVENERNGREVAMR